MEGNDSQSKRVGVHVIMSGIVSLIPRGTGCLIRLQDARNPGGGSGHHGHGGHLIDHVPAVVAELPLVYWPAAKQPYVTAKQVGARSLAGWILDYNRPVTVAVENHVDGPPLELKSDKLLRIASACPGGNCARPRPGPRGVELSADRGFIEASSLEPIRWRWRGTPDFADIAEEVCWSFWIEEPPLTLELPEANGGSWKLQVDAPGDGGDIEVRFQNVPRDEIIPGFVNASAGASTNMEEDHHAALYFEESTAPPQPVPILESDKSKPQAPLPPSGHRLEGRRIADRVVSSAVSPQTIRVNCPPALWE